jgi:electron transport complex protein RnfG
MKVTYLKQAWLVLALSLAFGGGLAGVHVALSERIETNKRNETFQRIPGLVGLARPEDGGVFQVTGPADDADIPTYQLLDAEGQALGSFVQHTSDDGKIAYEVFDAGGRAVGWVIKGSGKGYADTIEVLIGVNASVDRLIGVFVLDQKETPGLGDNIRSPEFTRRFAQQPVDDGMTVEGWSGATVSSRAVSTIINAALDDFRNWLTQRE